MDYTGALGYDPWSGITPDIKLKDNSKTIGEELTSLSNPNPILVDSNNTDPFSDFNFEDEGNLSEAIVQFINMVAKDSNADLAITELFKIFKQ